MTRTESCFVIEEYLKAYYKKVVEKIVVIVSYSERSSVTEKVSDFFVNGPPMKYFLMQFIFMFG
jgi:hypothetical protein